MNILAKRIPSILGLVVLVAALAGGAVLVRQRQQIQPRASAGGEPIDLAIGNISDRSFSVSWTTAEEVSGRLLIGEDLEQLTRWVNDTRDDQGKMAETTTHYVVVDNLKQGIRYEFRVESGGREYDSRGKPFSVSTAATPGGSLPVSDVAQGLVKTVSGTGAAGAIVYAQLPGGQLLSALAAESGNWVIPVSTSRTGDLSAWLPYDRMAAVYTIRADGGKDGKATAIVTTGIDQPAPPLTLGQNFDFRQGGQENQVTGYGLQVTGEPAREAESSLRSLFNFEDLGPVAPVSTGVTLLNPSEEGEEIFTIKPELFGEGPRDTEVNIIVESSETVEGSAMVGDDGKWKFAVPADLAPGWHTVTLQWTDAEGIIQTLRRSFIVQAATGEPAFTASPSATPKGGQAAPTKNLTPTAAPRQTVPATSSGTPKSGGLTPSAMLVMMGTLLIVSGGHLLRRPSR